MPWVRLLRLRRHARHRVPQCLSKGSRAQRRGAIDYSAPQTADRTGPFHAPIREVVRGAKKLEALVVEMHVRGLSTRGIEAVSADADGPSLLSPTAVSVITARLRAGVAVVGGAWRAMKSGSISLQTVFS